MFTFEFATSKVGLPTGQEIAAVLREAKVVSDGDGLGSFGKITRVEDLARMYLVGWVKHPRDLSSFNPHFQLIFRHMFIFGQRRVYLDRRSLWRS